MLSLSGLEACKELPSGFDRSLLRYRMLSNPFFYRKQHGKAAFYLFYYLVSFSQSLLFGYCYL